MELVETAGYNIMFSSYRLSPIAQSVACRLENKGHWLNRWLGQYFFRGLMIVTAKGFIPLSPLPIVLTMVMWESSQWLGKNIFCCSSYKNSEKHG